MKSFHFTAHPKLSQQRALAWDNGTTNLRIVENPFTEQCCDGGGEGVHSSPGGMGEGVGGLGWGVWG